MKNHAIRLWLISLLFLCVSCIEYPHEPGQRKPQLKSLSSPVFEIENLPTPSKRNIVSSGDTFLLEEIQFNPITVRYWRPNDGGSHPAVLLLPAIWGDRYLAGFAEKLVKEGFVCLQLPSNRYLEQIRENKTIQLGGLAEMMKVQVIEANEMLAWLSNQPEVDPERIGVMGISIGAILASLLTEQNDQIQAAAFILGGGNLPEIMTAPQGYVKKRLRERIISENNMTEEEFQSEASQAFQEVDPLTYAGRLEAARIFMVNGRFDKVIPYKNAKQLWNALGRPTWLVIPAGHYTASLFLRYIRYRVTEHFLTALHRPS